MTTIDKLQALGFTGNEAKAYISLLGCQPASAYEIAKQAGLPTSKIYETVNRLVERGVFHAASEDSQQQYFAINPSDLMATICHTTIQTTRQLLPELENLQNDDDNSLVWPLLSPDQIKSKSIELIEEAERTILVSLWPEELDLLETALVTAADRGVQIALVHFGPPRTVIGATYHHPAEKTLYSEKGGRGLTLVADGQRVVIANFGADGTINGSWSRNHSFVTVAEDYVKHDVYITKVTRFLDAEVKQRFGEDYSRLRDVFDAEA